MGLKKALSASAALFACTVSLSLASASPAYAQTAPEEGDVSVEAYSALLTQMADLDMSIELQNVHIQSQQAEIERLEAELANIEALKESVPAVIDKMVAAMDNAITEDIPFKRAERFARLGKVQDDVASDEVGIGEKMRQALNLYDAEIGFGYSLEAYDGNHPLTPGGRLAACQADLSSSACALDEDLQDRVTAGATADDLANDLLDGVYLRYGRLALVYSDINGGSALRYDKASDDWVDVPGGRLVDVRRNIRIARGESAPGVVTAPIMLGDGAVSN